MKSESINELLKLLQNSENKYFETADVIKILHLKRFLNRQSSLRNHYLYSLIELLSAEEIEYTHNYVDKNLLYTNGDVITKELEDFDFRKRVKLCIEKDNTCMDICDQIFSENNLPIAILEKIITIKTNLLLNIIELNTTLATLKTEVDNQKDSFGKILNLHIA